MSASRVGVVYKECNGQEQQQTDSNGELTKIALHILYSEPVWGGAQRRGRVASIVLRSSPLFTGSGNTSVGIARYGALVGKARRGQGDF